MYFFCVYIILSADLSMKTDSREKPQVEQQRTAYRVLITSYKIDTIMMYHSTGAGLCGNWILMKLNTSCFKRGNSDTMNEMKNNQHRN